MIKEPTMSCQQVCVVLGVLVALFVFMFLVGLGGYNVVTAGFLGVIAGAILAALIMWLFCSDMPSLQEIQAQREGDGDAPAETAETVAEPAPAPAAAAAPAPVAVAEPEPAPEPEPTPEPEPAPESEPVAAEELGAGTKPQTLDAAREGGPDDLKKIKGVGPKLEALLHSMGFYHFDQVAAWGASEVAWVDQNLEGFKGRVSRDNWVEQAKLLASGGETEFSKKVDGGDVY